MTAADLSAAFRSAVETYNAYRSPMVTATILDAREREWRVQFEGPFHQSCCRDDYFDDLRYELAEYGVPVDAVGIGPIERRDRETFVVTFTVECDRPAAMPDRNGPAAKTDRRSPSFDAYRSR